MVRSLMNSKVRPLPWNMRTSASARVELPADFVCVDRVDGVEVEQHLEAALADELGEGFRCRTGGNLERAFFQRTGLRRRDGEGASQRYQDAAYGGTA